MAEWRRLTYTVPESSLERLVVCLHELGCLGAQHEAGRVDAYFPGRTDAALLTAAVQQELGAAGRELALESSELVPDGMWQERWVASLTPFEVGRRLLIVPGEATSATSSERIPIRISPGSAFGTGEHVTTRMCLEMLEGQARLGESLLDVGTGSGILAIAGYLLGAGPILALDTDTTAVEVARRNARANGAAQIMFAAASVEALAPERFDLVVANIDARALARLAGPLARRSRRRAILSGILLDQEPEVLSAFERHGLLPSETSRGEGWVAVSLRRRGDD